MVKGYLAIGHGTRVSGVLDPGAVVPGNGPREHDLATHVVIAAAKVLRDQGVEFYQETASGPSLDPDYVGSANAVNNGRYDWALEVHFDSFHAPRGGFGLYISPAGKRWAELIHAEYENRGLKTRGNTERPGLYFLRRTKCPAILWECDRVGRDVTMQEIARYGEAIAVGTLRWLTAMNMWRAEGQPEQPSPATPQPPGPRPQEPSEPVPPAARPDSRPARAFPGHLLKQGSSDHASVRALQQRLHDLGYGIRVDGDFGPQTYGIVRDFQRDQKIAIDGVVGRETWGRLFK